MPILDPSLMLTLLENKDPLDRKSRSFIIKCLDEASKNVSRNIDTIESAVQFKKDFKAGYNHILEYFQAKVQKKEIDNHDIYKLLYRSIKTDLKAQQSRYDFTGSYYLYGSSLRLYQPCLENDARSWFLTSTKVAVLCIHTFKEIEQPLKQFKLFCVEVDIMISCGYSVVICVNYDSISIEFNEILVDLFKTHHFTEIHLILEFSDTSMSKKKKLAKLIDSLNNLLTSLIVNSEKFESFFYLYSRFFNEKLEKANILLKKLKQKHLFECFSFSKSVKEAIKKEFELIQSNLFVFSKNGFNTDLVFVQLQNVALYKSADEENDFTPSKVSGFTTAYMSIKDYMNWNQTRVEVLFDDEENSNDFVKMYVDFNDLHLIKIGSYVNETLYLTKTEKSTLDSVDLILENQFKKFDKNDDFKKESIFGFIKDRKIKKFLTYVAYAYSKHEILKNPNFSMHKNQIFTALEACNVFLTDNKNGKDSNSGVIYQVETGEGKSCIICLIASLLALMKKTVHITSSNITLANRDYYESYNFFKMLGLKSAVLLHYNELPVNLKSKKSNEEEEENEKKKNKKMSNENSNETETENKKEKEEANNNEFAYNPEFFPKEFFSKKLFQNSSNMNFSVCGINNDNELTNNKANIVFSTFVNFESLYLRLMEIFPGMGNDFFGKCSLIIDEADSILIDEITNGTILSRSMKTNGSEVLKFIYQSYIDKRVNENEDEKENEKKAEEVLREVQEKFPKCSDLNIDHIKDMFSQIKLVNQDEFINGKKYSIEKKEVKEKLSLKSLFEKSKELIDVTQEKVKETAKKGVKKVQNKIKKSKSKNSIVEVEEAYNDEDDDDNDDTNETDEVYDVEEVAESPKKHDKKKKKDKEEKKKKKKKDEVQTREEISNKHIFKKTLKRKVHVYKEIVPFDYDHKGVLEPNKEFSGFVQQFIAIKEMRNNKDNHNMIIKDVSMNYLYVSHPIFVDLYGSVCGLTGTIGNKFDKKLFKEQYKLITKKIPRNRPNLRIEYPVILCDSITERNHKIASEVIDFNKNGYPVLVIFQDLNEMSALFNLLSSKGIKNINIFDGKDEKIKPDRIAGIKGAVSLGTNVCGRGTDIKNPAKPLHVIVTYFSSNTRVMNQAFGRTARQGQKGSVRIICLQDQYISPIGIFNKLEMDNVLSDFQLKNRFQIDFINRFKSKRNWIFQGGIKHQKFTDEQMQLLRATRININRLTSFNYEFPICMSIPTFLLIQAQKIFSLYNCPNCKYTWILFQKYIREMILESWSLFIEQAERKFYTSEMKVNFEDYLRSECERLYGWLCIYLPEYDDPSQCDIVPTFMKIFEFIKIRYETKIFSSFPPKLSGLFKNYGRQQYISFNIGFKPYNLIDESGASIKSIDGEALEQTFIQDPELKYIRKMPHHRFSVLSITERIDGLFDLICKKINDVLGSKLGLRFFLRRTLGGCEFGICYDFNIQNIDAKVISDTNCLVDKDPLLLFTITVKSMVPILAGILIILLVYIASILKSIGQWISAFPVKLSTELIKKTVKTVAKLVVDSQIEKFCDALSSFLYSKVKEQIANLKSNKSDLVHIFSVLLDIAAPKDFAECGDKITDFFKTKIDDNMKCNIGFTSNLADKIVDGLPTASFLKIGFLLLLCFSSFMINFHMHKQALKYNTEKAAAKYDGNQDAEEALDQNENIEIKTKVKKIEVVKVDFK
ncbi:hypothetical protein M9Y10_029495 [Tritrichomonas musculus]|uniref:SecA family profile domain-containing protein n=1 Tax=Tritrichomonas musculus TaxID=1915356 RepID=A0ABR2KMC1_9EUKA